VAALPGAVKVFIVERLACFDPPSDVVAAVKQGFGITVSKQQVSAYSPILSPGKRLGSALTEVFETTRASYLQARDGIAISHRSYRLRLLDRMLDRAIDQENDVLVAKLLEFAAKEVGDYFVSPPGTSPATFHRPPGAR
jgi:hypothetical protein